MGAAIAELFVVTKVIDCVSSGIVISLAGAVFGVLLCLLFQRLFFRGKKND